MKGYHFAWGPLPRDRCDQLYRDFRRFGAFAGLGEEVGPSDYEEFRRYYDRMLAGSFLGSHPLSSEIAEAVVHPPAPWRDRVRGHATDFLPIETLPPRIRSCLGLRSTRWTRVRMAMFRVVAPLAFQVCPKRLTYYPESFRAERARGLL